MAKKPQKKPTTMKVIFSRRGWKNNAEGKFYRRSDIPQDVPVEYRNILPSVAEIVEDDFSPSEDEPRGPVALSELSKDPSPEEVLEKKGK